VQAAQELASDTTGVVGDNSCKAYVYDNTLEEQDADNNGTSVLHLFAHSMLPNYVIFCFI
jgi:hypothetical protein